MRLSHITAHLVDTQVRMLLNNVAQLMLLLPNRLIFRKSTLTSRPRTNGRVSPSAVKFVCAPERRIIAPKTRTREGSPNQSLVFHKPNHPSWLLISSIDRVLRST